MGASHILLTASNNIAGVQRWVESSTVMTEQFQPVIAMYRDHFTAQPHCKVLKIDQQWPGNVKRFIHMKSVITHLGANRWFLWSDCADVVFQRAPVFFDTFGKDIRAIVCSEGVTVGEKPELAPFLSNPRFSSLKDLPLHNAGFFAIRGDFFIEFIDFISSVVATMKVVPTGVDQLLFNYWIAQKRQSIITNESLCLNVSNRFIDTENCTVGDLKDGQGMLVNGRFVNRLEAEYPIIHANGTSKMILQRWKQK